MGLKPTHLWRNPFRADREATTIREAGRSKGDQAFTVGVPMAKLIKRRLESAPEIVMLAQPRSLAAESFRRLKTVLVNRHGGRARVLVVTSASPGDGKTTVALNLALAFAADHTDRTLLIDGDLRRPGLARWLKPAPRLGLGEILAEDTDPEHAVLILEDSPLEILPAGEHAENPMELLGAPRSRALLSTLRERYARIIIDSPPIVPFTDADALGALSDGVLLVARSGETTLPKYKQAVSAVTSAPILGVVLNDVTRSLADWHRYSKYDYDRYYKKEREG